MICKGRAPRTSKLQKPRPLKRETLNGTQNGNIFCGGFYLLSPTDPDVDLNNHIPSTSTNGKLCERKIILQNVLQNKANFVIQRSLSHEPLSESSSSVLKCNGPRSAGCVNSSRSVFFGDVKENKYHSLTDVLHLMNDILPEISSQEKLKCKLSRQKLLHLSTSPSSQKPPKDWMQLRLEFPDLFNLENLTYVDPTEQEYWLEQLESRKCVSLFVSSSNRRQRSRCSSEVSD
ncbi:uncharacterized protein LOC115221111 isoform X2 [Octopus sinensis]|uniref:Uncharacterized protein LOC115221111 isoform X2 n=1 Tax=Octopus sinensis TaxID=2607531 RepID=A0A7E6FEH9_9MOLL|nr:uncharacterized protein LOC115221111 isoform X2 [Octopus sinensis]